MSMINFGKKHFAGVLDDSKSLEYTGNDLRFLYFQKVTPEMTKIGKKGRKSISQKLQIVQIL